MNAKKLKQSGKHPFGIYFRVLAPIQFTVNSASFGYIIVPALASRVD